MATIRKRGKRWVAQVRRKGFPSISRSFASNTEAKAWAGQEEARIDRGDAKPDHVTTQRTTLKEVIGLYLERVTPTKRSAVTERQRLSKLQRDPITALSMSELTAAHVADYRDRRLRDVGAGTIRRELSLLRHALDTAYREWGIHVPHNPVAAVRRPKPPPFRDRRLRPGEYGRLMEAIATCRNPLLAPFVRWAKRLRIGRASVYRAIGAQERSAAA